MEKLVYICHQYGGLEGNYDKITKLVRELTEEYPECCFLSPVHALSYLDYNENRCAEIEKCIFLLDMCDEMWVFGENSLSDGCLKEKEYCGKHKIPIIDKGVVD